MSSLSHQAAHEIARDLGCLVSSRKRAPSSNDVHGADQAQPRLGLLTRLGTWIRMNYERRRTADQLGQLTDYMLEDIGLNRADIDRVSRTLNSPRGRGRFAA